MAMIEPLSDGVLDGFKEHRALSYVISMGRATPLNLLSVRGPVLILDEVVEGPALGVKLVPSS